MKRRSRLDAFVAQTKALESIEQEQDPEPEPNDLPNESESEMVPQEKKRKRKLGGRGRPKGRYFNPYDPTGSQSRDTKSRGSIPQSAPMGRTSTIKPAASEFTYAMSKSDGLLSAPAISTRPPPKAVVLPENLSLDELDSLTCTICLDILYKPVVTQCLHRFCKECIGKHFRQFEKKTKLCPLCNKHFSLRGCREDSRTERMVGMLFPERVIIRDQEQALAQSNDFEAQEVINSSGGYNTLGIDHILMGSQQQDLSIIKEAQERHIGRLSKMRREARLMNDKRRETEGEQISKRRASVDSITFGAWSNHRCYDMHEVYREARLQSIQDLDQNILKDAYIASTAGRKQVNRETDAFSLRRQGAISSSQTSRYERNIQSILVRQGRLGTGSSSSSLMSNHTSRANVSYGTAESRGNFVPFAAQTYVNNEPGTDEPPIVYEKLPAIPPKHPHLSRTWKEQQEYQRVQLAQETPHTNNKYDGKGYSNQDRTNDNDHGNIFDEYNGGHYHDDHDGDDDYEELQQERLRRKRRLYSKPFNKRAKGSAHHAGRGSKKTSKPAAPAITDRQNRVYCTRMAAFNLPPSRFGDAFPPLLDEELGFEYVHYESDMARYVRTHQREQKKSRGSVNGRGRSSNIRSFEVRPLSRTVSRTGSSRSVAASADKDKDGKDSKALRMRESTRLLERDLSLVEQMEAQSQQPYLARSQYLPDSQSVSSSDAPRAHTGPSSEYMPSDSMVSFYNPNRRGRGKRTPSLYGQEWNPTRRDPAGWPKPQSKGTSGTSESKSEEDRGKSEEGHHSDDQSNQNDGDHSSFNDGGIEIEGIEGNIAYIEGNTIYMTGLPAKHPSLIALPIEDEEDFVLPPPLPPSSWMPSEQAPVDRLSAVKSLYAEAGLLTGEEEEFIQEDLRRQRQIEKVLKIMEEQQIADEKLRERRGEKGTKCVY